MKKIILLLLPLLFASCYKEVDITTLDITSTVEPAYTTANVSAESNIASSNLNLRIHLATNSDMDQNLQTIELGNAEEGYCQKVVSNLTDGTTYYYQLEGYSNSTQKQFDIGSFTTLTAEPPTVTTRQPSNITNTTATSGGEITFDGGLSVSTRGVCWSTSANPTTSNSHTNNGTGTGSFTSTLSGLSAKTTYYVRAYATNAKGTSYGNTWNFTTEAAAPTVTTNNVTNITTSTATCGGNVTANGGANVTARGVCWSTSTNPTISNSHTTNGTGSGAFTSSITGLSAGTTYYVRAYATNSAGTSYGSNVSFTTSANLATVTTAAVSNITGRTATCGGNVTATGGASVTEKGVCWSTNANPTINNSHTSNGSGVGSFTINITGLTQNTTYYVRAYAINSAGTAYGSQVTFTTITPSEDIDITVNGYTFRMKHVESGTFSMGAQSTNSSGTNYDAEANNNESPVHYVNLSHFYIGETEVTQGLWNAVMGAGSTSHGSWTTTYGLGSNYPAYYINYYDIQSFISQLNSITGLNFRMPTEAEWEYAARGGNQRNGNKYSGSNTINNVAWYNDNSGSTAHPVKSKSPNELGLYDMSGNVWEWCSDWYGGYGSSSQTNPTGPASGSYIVTRGGSWNGPARGCRVSSRGYYGTDRSHTSGFRLVLPE